MSESNICWVQSRRGWIRWLFWIGIGLLAFFVLDWLTLEVIPYQDWDALGAFLLGFYLLGFGGIFLGIWGILVAIRYVRCKDSSKNL